MKDLDPIEFDWEEFKFNGITQGMVKRWEKRYDKVDIIYLIQKKIPEWLEKKKDNKQAHKKKWRSFLLRWFSRDQEKAVFQ